MVLQKKAIRKENVTNFHYMLYKADQGNKMSHHGEDLLGAGDKRVQSSEFCWGLELA